MGCFVLGSSKLAESHIEFGKTLHGVGARLRVALAELKARGPVSGIVAARQGIPCLDLSP
jgi:hypothetical protein